MIKEPLLLFLTQLGLDYRLELRINSEPLVPPQIGRTHGQYILTLPEPIITIAQGTSHQMLKIAHERFGAPTNMEFWTYAGDYIWWHAVDLLGD